MIERFEFAAATRIIFGSGASSETGRLAAELGRRAFLVTGRDPTRSQALLDILQERKLATTTFAVAGEPDLETVQQGAAQARLERCDVVVAIGGGSVLDAAKAIAAMLANAGDLLDYLEIIGQGKPLQNPSVPLICIPTTAGTGSEVTRNAVLASPEHGLKVSLRSPLMLPRVALVDPGLTCSLPPSVSSSTGLDALTQLIEPYVCTRANLLTDALCAEGIRRAARSLGTAFHDGSNVAAREDMSVASLFGGLALANAGLGAVHGLAGPIGGMFPAPHGAVCAALLPHVMRVNLRALSRLEVSDAKQPRQTRARYAQVARWLTNEDSATAESGVNWVTDTITELKIPPLRVYGIKPVHTADLVAKALNASSMKANPVPLTNEELAEALRSAL